ncbi:MAG: hypothetical protein BAJALOKI3v1_50122 [Promethearchaeota archaeon]|nr:MAG: hypothetical protein BAJALOKI3v1_50122 [Candidatus Lokiarchaeota archaeon]
MAKIFHVSSDETRSLFVRDDGYAWDVTNTTTESWDDASFDDYLVTPARLGTSGSIWQYTVPSDMPSGNWSMIVYPTTSPSINILPEASVDGWWDGYLWLDASSPRTRVNLEDNNNVLYVNKDGNDSYSGRSWNNAKLTLDNAKNSASSGYTIHVGPGIYNNSTNLLVNGVNWNFLPGTTINQTSSNLFDDASGAVTFNITGKGCFNTTLDFLKLSNSSSVYCEVDRVVSESRVIGNEDAHIDFVGNYIESSDGTVDNVNSPSRTFIKVNHIKCSGHALECDGGFIDAEINLIESHAEQPPVNSVGSNAQVVIRNCRIKQFNNTIDGALQSETSGCNITAINCSFDLIGTNYQAVTINGNIDCINCAINRDAITTIGDGVTNIYSADASGVWSFDGRKVLLDDEEDVYHANVQVNFDDSQSRDEYTAFYYRNADIITNISGVKLNVTDRDGSLLISNQNMSGINNTGMFVYNESSNRISAGVSALVSVSGLANGNTRLFSTLVSRSNEA